MKRGFSKRILAFVIALAVVASTVFAMPTASQAAAKKKLVVKGAVSNTLVVRKNKSFKLSLSDGTKTLKRSTYKANYKFVSSKPSVASVDEAGVIKAKKTGTTTITISAKKSKLSTKVKVIVPKKVVKSIKLNATKVTLNNSKKTAQLKVTFNPKKPTCTLVKWTSSNEKVAVVSSKGKVTAKGAGTATITAKSVDGSKKATCKVTVTGAKKITLARYERTIGLGGTWKIKVTKVTPAKYFGKVTYKSSDTKVATVSNKGVVTGKKVGKAKITVSIGSKKTTFKVNVKKSKPVIKDAKGKTVTSLTFTKKGETAVLTSKITPVRTTAKYDGTWKSSNEKVATVDKNGKVTAVGNGTANIFIKLDNGNDAICKVTVKLAATDVKISVNKTEIKANETAKVTVTGSTAKVTATPAVVTVAADGTVTPKKGSGKQEVTLTVDGTKASTKLTVIFTEDAVTSDSNGYTIKLNTKAEAYDVVDVNNNNKTYVVKPADVKSDMETVAAKLSAAKNATDLVQIVMDKDLKTIAALGLTTTLNKDQSVTVTVAIDGHATKEFTLKAVAANAIDVVYGDKTVNITNIAISATAITAKVNGHDVALNFAANKYEVKLDNGNSGSVVASADAYTISINKADLNRVLAKLDVTDKLADKSIVIKNDYNK